MKANPKNGLCIFICLLLTTVSSAQGFVLTGHIEGLKDTIIFLSWSTDWNNDDSSRMDSVSMKNGDFRFRGKAAAWPMKAILSVRDFQDYKNSTGFYLENAVLHIEGKVDSMHKAFITGSPAQGDYERFKLSVKEVYEELADLGEKEEKVTDTAVKSYIRRREEVLQEEYNRRVKKFVVTNPRSIISLDQLNMITGYSPRYKAADYRTFSDLFGSLDRKLQNSPKGRALIGRLRIVRRTLPGAMAPLFTQKDTKGIPVTLAAYKGKYVLLDFWASWCGPCRQENPNIVKAFNKYRSKGFTVLGISLDGRSGEGQWKAAIQKDQLTWTNLSDLKGSGNAVAQLYGVRSIPCNFLIDPRGIIIGRNLQGEEISQKLAELFP